MPGKDQRGSETGAPVPWPTSLPALGNLHHRLAGVICAEPVTKDLKRHRGRSTSQELGCRVGDQQALRQSSFSFPCPSASSPDIRPKLHPVKLPTIFPRVLQNFLSTWPLSVAPACPATSSALFARRGSSFPLLICRQSSPFLTATADSTPFQYGVRFGSLLPLAFALWPRLI
ncbi:hypothetical protein VTN00DRAFT_743 [Thermoascus crustaceus]|uniref:uncharacterized protein n=1 Tax=Thermoascus crustaceus TaxID=5088 RepID=UPI0037449EAF